VASLACGCTAIDDFGRFQVVNDVQYDQGFDSGNRDAGDTEGGVPFALVVTEATPIAVGDLDGGQTDLVVMPDIAGTNVDLSH
jgi:hypothetical protein